MFVPFLPPSITALKLVADAPLLLRLVCGPLDSAIAAGVVATTDVATASVATAAVATAPLLLLLFNICSYRIHLNVIQNTPTSQKTICGLPELLVE